MKLHRFVLLAAAAMLVPACDGTINNNSGARPETTDRISTGPAGIEGNGISENPAVSEDGRYVVYQSNAPNLVAGDTNLRTDIFRRDLTTGETVIVSLADNENLASNRCETPAVSGDGRYVVFVSNSINLTTNGTNGQEQVYRRDVLNGDTVLVSCTAAGVQGIAPSTQPAISRDGNFVAFSVDSADLSGLSQRRILLKNLTTGALILVSSRSAIGLPSQGDWTPSVSENGLFVAYAKFSTGDVYRWDVLAGTEALVSVNSGGVNPGNDSSDSPRISRDGNLVLFRSDATNLTLTDRTGSDIFLRDMTLAQTTLVSVDSAGSGDLGDAIAPSMSSDGRFIAFSSDAGNLTPGDSNLGFDVFVHDRQTGRTQRTSVRTFGQETPVGSLSTLPCLPLDGRFVIFQSNAPTLVDQDNNGVEDIFLRTLSW